MVNNKSIDLVYSQSFITENANETFSFNSSQNKVYSITHFSRENMIKCLPGCMPLWKKSLHEKAGFFNENYKHAGDWEMWLRAAAKGSKFKKINDILGLYYFNPRGISTNPENFSWKREEEQEIYEKYESMQA